MAKLTKAQRAELRQILHLVEKGAIKLPGDPIPEFDEASNRLASLIVKN